jgi:hypothetical protein
MLAQDLNRSVEKAVRSWAPELRRAFEPYWRNLRSTQAARKPSSAENENGRYWLVLPSWLEGRYFPGRTREIGAVSRLVHDVLWAQYALFVAIRIQDDLFDGQVQAPALIFVADQFLLEAESSFRAVCKEYPAFWSTYRQCLQVTSQAIVETDVLLQSQTASPEVLLAKYAEVSAIFKLGSAAVCVCGERFQEFSDVGRFCDEMAIVSQIYDDLEDVVEDLKGGRCNVVARILGIGPSYVGCGESITEVVSAQLFGQCKTDLVLAEARNHLDLAEKAIRPFGLPAAGPYLVAQGETVGDLERIFRDRDSAELADHVFRSGGLGSLLRGIPTPVW